MKIIIPLLLTALLLSGCGQANKQINPAAPSQGATEAAPAPQEVYIMAGKIDAKEQATITSRISAKVSQISVDVGSQVKKGDPLVTLDTNDIQTQVKQAEAAVETARANLNNTTAGSRPEQIVQAQAVLDSAKEAYENTKKNFERTEILYNNGAVSLQQYEASKAQLSASDAQYKSAQSQLSMLKQGATKEAVSVVQNQVQQAQAGLEVVKTQLNNGTILSPVSGTVVEKNINAGELASPGVRLLSIVNNEDLCVNAYLPMGLLDKVKQSQQVIIKVSETPDKKYDGEITVVNTVINSQSKNVLVKIAIKNPDAALKPGMFAEIALKQ